MQTAFVRVYQLVLLPLLLSGLALAQDPVLVRDLSDPFQPARATGVTIDDSDNLDGLGSITLDGLSANQLVYTDAAKALTSLGAATNGQIPIGSTGAAPVLATIAGTTNQVVSTPGAGTITLSLPQSIHTGASPTFTGLTLSGLTNKYVPYSNSGALTGAAGLQFDAANGDLELSTTGAAAGVSIGGDTRIYRSAAATLTLDTNLAVQGTFSTPQLGNTYVGYGDSSNRLQSEAAFAYDATGDQLRLATSGSGAGILLGGDANLYRTAANKLKTDDTFIAPSIGVGTDSPAELLTLVGGNIRMGNDAYYSTSNAYNLFVVEDDTNSLGVANSSLWTANTNAVIAFDTNSNNVGDFIVGEDNVDPGATGWDTRFIVKAGGNVGIGQASPGNPLDVAGSIEIESPGVLLGDSMMWRASASNISGSGWLDIAGINATDNEGFMALANGSFLRMGVLMEVKTKTVNGTLTFTVYEDAVGANISVSPSAVTATGHKKALATAARGTYTFTAQDDFQVYCSFGTFAGSIDAWVWIEVIYDA